MLFLSKASLEYAVKICIEKEKYKVGIAIMNEENKNAARDLILDMISKTDHVEKIYRNSSNFRITFKNKSEIRFIPAAESSRGNRLHLLIADKTIPLDILQNVLKPCENIEWLKYAYEQRAKVKTK